MGPLVVGVFHRNLAETHPSHALLFESFCNGAVDIRDILMMREMSTVVESLGDLTTIGDLLQKIAQQMQALGFKERHFLDFEVVLMKTLEVILADNLSNAVRFAWSSAFRSVTAQLIADADSLQWEIAGDLRWGRRRHVVRRSSWSMGGNRFRNRRAQEAFTWRN